MQHSNDNDARRTEPAETGPWRALRAVGGLCCMLGLGLGLAEGWAALRAGFTGALIAPPGWWTAIGAVPAIGLAWVPPDPRRAPLEAVNALGTLLIAGAALGSGADVGPVALVALGSMLILGATAPRPSSRWRRPDGLLVLAAVMAVLTMATLGVELSRATARWVQVQRAGGPRPDAPRFTDGRGLPQAESRQIAVRWLPGTEPVVVPPRSRPAPIEDGEAALGPTRALANVVLIVDLADPDAPAWLDLVDAVQDARREVARIVVKVAPDGDCAAPDSCAWARLHYCAAEQGRAWDLLDLRASDAAMRAPAATLGARLGLDAAQLESCLASRPARLGALRAGAAVRVMKREGLPWLDVEGFGWTGTPPLAGDVIAMIDSVIAAYKGADAVQPRRMEPRWEGAQALPDGVGALRPPASAADAEQTCADAGLRVCTVDTLVVACRGSREGETPRRSGAARFRLADPCARPEDCAALVQSASLGRQPEWARAARDAASASGPIGIDGGPGCVEVSAATDGSSFMAFRCCADVQAEADAAPVTGP